ncbi:unnamed protein product, partial [Prorocentrum cordatum]
PGCRVPGCPAARAPRDRAPRECSGTWLAGLKLPMRASALLGMLLMLARPAQCTR